MSNSQDVHQNTTRNGYRSAFNRLLAEGDDAVYYLNGSGKLGGPVATDFQAQAGPIAGAGTFLKRCFVLNTEYCQDRLGTNIRKAEERRHVFCRLPRVKLRVHRIRALYWGQSGADSQENRACRERAVNS